MSYSQSSLKEKYILKSVEISLSKINKFLSLTLLIAFSSAINSGLIRTVS